MKASVDDQRCRGHGVCVTICPEVFTLTDDGYSVVENPEVPSEFEKAVQEAVECCPEQAISASDD
jgi:ferredoxin